MARASIDISVRLVFSIYVFFFLQFQTSNDQCKFFRFECMPDEIAQNRATNERTDLVALGLELGRNQLDRASLPPAAQLSALSTLPRDRER